MNPKNQTEIFQILESRADFYNQPSFIVNDPISIPHIFSRKEDVEIAGFLAATLSWGQRKSILVACNRLMVLMQNQPYEFVLNADKTELDKLNGFVYRTFQYDDLLWFIEGLKFIYLKRGGLESVFYEGFKKSGDVWDSILNLNYEFQKIPHLKRSEKHLANPEKGSACKRLNMFLRWMVRKDEKGVDFGIWHKIPMLELLLPLDVHVANISRKFGLLSRKQNDRKAVDEIMKILRTYCPEDPVKYDYALFSLGCIEKYNLET